jgi:pimeloyl-ACP methyl ester carboxylesterase
MNKTLATLALVISVFAASPAPADESSPQIWLISTRDLPQCGDLGESPQNACYWQLNEQCEWSPADAKSFRATDDAGVPTVVFVHGNRTRDEGAVESGMYVYRILNAQACGRAFRYVIWSWPAEPAAHPAGKDARLKTHYCDAESYYLAGWLRELKAGLHVSLVGHSYGSRIIAGTLELLAGGEVGGRSLAGARADEWNGGERKPLRAVLMAAAIDADWFACHGDTLNLVDQVLVTRNRCDWLLRLYPRLDRGCGPEAMGFTGPCLPEDGEKVSVVDVGGDFGRRHDMRLYSSALGMYGLWARYTFLDDLPTQP